MIVFDKPHAKHEVKNLNFQKPIRSLGFIVPLCGPMKATPLGW